MFHAIWRCQVKGYNQARHSLTSKTVPVLQSKTNISTSLEVVDVARKANLESVTDADMTTGDFLLRL